MKKTVIIGAGGHARVLISTLKTLGCEIIGILDQNQSLCGQLLYGIPVLGGDAKIEDLSPDTIELVNGIGSVSSEIKRKEIFLKFKENGFSFKSVVHPSALVLDDVSIGEGVQIMAGAIIQSFCSIGDNSVINTGAIVDHDSIIGDHTHIAPGAVLSGGVHIGNSVHIGTSAAVIQGIEVGDHVIVGAGAAVVNNIAPGMKALGVPARKK